MVQKSITSAWFAEKFNCTESDISQIVSAEEIDGLVYEILTTEQQNAVVDELTEVNRSAQLRVSTQDSNPVWEKGWGEVFQRLASSEDIAREILKPQYFGKDTRLRFDGQYIRAKSNNFEYRMDLLIRKVAFSHYFSAVNNIVELGCGTANSLLLLSELYPDKPLQGADWATSSQKIVEKLARQTGKKLSGVNFNMFTCEGANSLEVNSDTGVLTVHALEQLGPDFQTILALLLDKKPKVCVHLEPISELYQANQAYDQVALDYHKKRNYLAGFYSELKRLEQEDQIEILCNQRLGFGGLYHEAYSLVVWRMKRYDSK
ncbi:hypothetical protein [Thalassotalea euphylliae]|uniref:Class I SAM-dependent methyltransferase n=1 Tax=Thalassotalea euphylliae TaxID=1655234 RepID=A0A3E0UDC7_9GAMM|nr:hypothetical protein [Thalassotalea euphylliae]REL34830.1 hypothetical protein DXX92_05345 [Thalassotalea euphylliae]